MLKTIGAALLLSSLMVASAHPLAPQAQRMAAPVRAGVRLAQSTCWYVVLHCKKSKADVENWKQINGGDVINTSSDEFPGFAPDETFLIPSKTAPTSRLVIEDYLKRSGLDIIPDHEVDNITHAVSMIWG
jgi:hypothetical protein